jgi:4a-hydroxytetrahydrobiopterin dehydratase
MARLEDLLSRKSVDQPKGTPPLSAERVAAYLSLLPEWKLTGAEIRRTFTFKDFHETLAFVNKVAAIANAENHHPDMEVSYNKCTVRYATHSIGGLSENDFICAAEVDQLVK